MLIRFRVGNYLSFNETVTLCMAKGITRVHGDHVKDIGDGTGILRASAIYGANASGKTNLVKALRDMRNMVTKGSLVPENRYFRPAPGNEVRPSYFEVEIELDGALYSYGFEYVISVNTVVDEWLHVLHVDRDSDLVFERTGDRIVHGFEGEDATRMGVYAEDMVGHSDRLFLTSIGSRVRPNDSGMRVLLDISDWFRKGLHFIDTEYPFSPEYGLSEADFDRINSMIVSFGTGINSMQYCRRTGMEDSLPPEVVDGLRRALRSGGASAGLRLDSRPYMSVNEYRVSLQEDGDLAFDEIVYRHNGDRVVFRRDEESDGTRKLYGLLASVFSGAEGVTYIMDELDSGLHPQLAYRFVSLFLEHAHESDSQMVFTTHESSLMDFELLRRDEIWFMDKNGKGESDLYSLEEFNERNDRKLDKAYLDGRYGGIPIFSAVYPCE